MHPESLPGLISRMGTTGCDVGDDVAPTLLSYFSLYVLFRYF